MHPHLFLTLRALHVLAGALWVGSAVLTAYFVLPSVIASGPAGGQVMRFMAQARKLPVYLSSVMGTTLLTGLALYWVDSGGFQWGWITSRTGLAFTVGALLAIITMIIAQVVAVPMVKQMGRLGAAIAASGAPPTPEQGQAMARLQTEMLKGSRIGATLVLLAVLLMAVARFL